ncbi:MAG: ComEA family DNA-binding protein [Microgenomates group bacterium]
MKQYIVLIVIGVVGSGILVYGLWRELGAENPVVEIIKSGQQSSEHLLLQGSELIVDVAGAVEKPGVYKLPSDSRIGDALVVAGGLSAEADREWVAKTINLAEVLKDGGKVYIPTRQEIKPFNQSTIKPLEGSGKVNINTASLAELDSLAGIGEVRARAIMDNRPYSNIEDLVSKAKLPSSVYEKIKDSITIY